MAPYHNSIIKLCFNYLSAVCGLMFFLPPSIIIGVIISLTSEGGVFFKQKRIGKNGKPFILYKFRTMISGADKMQKKYAHLNISDGPTFKIPKDPRYTKFGKYLVKTGLDELPQLINIIKGEMSVVGPRPFPVNEEEKLTSSQKIRETVLPGITSLWVIRGAHNLKFNKWMKLDREYVEKATFKTDLYILTSTILLISKLTIKKIGKVIRPQN